MSNIYDKSALTLPLEYAACQSQETRELSRRIEETQGVLADEFLEDLCSELRLLLHNLAEDTLEAVRWLDRIAVIRGGGGRETPGGIKSMSIKWAKNFINQVSRQEIGSGTSYLEKLVSECNERFKRVKRLVDQDPPLESLKFAEKQCDAIRRDLNYFNGCLLNAIGAASRINGTLLEIEAQIKVDGAADDSK